MITDLRESFVVSYSKSDFKARATAWEKIKNGEKEQPRSRYQEDGIAEGRPASRTRVSDLLQVLVHK